MPGSRQSAKSARRLPVFCLLQSFSPPTAPGRREIPAFSARRAEFPRFGFLIDTVGRHTQEDLGHGGNGRAQADMEQGRPLHLAHQVHRRDPYAERAEHPLQHDKQGFPAAVEIPDKAEKDGGEQAVDGICYLFRR